MKRPNKRITSVAFTLLILLSVLSVVQVGAAGSSFAATAEVGERTIDGARGYVDSMSTALSGDRDETPPQAAVSVPEKVMVNESVTLTAKNVSDDTGVKHVYWHFDSRRAAAGANATGTFTEPGVRSATLLLVDEAGNRNMITRQVFVLSDKPPEASLSAPKTAELGKKVKLDASATVTHNPIEYYSWDFDGDGKTDRKTKRATVTYAYSTLGDHQPTVTAVDIIGLKDSATANVSVVDTTPPTATLHVPETIVVNESFSVRASKVTDASGIDHICWYFDGVEGPNSKTATHTFTSTGVHNVTLSLKDGAGNWNKITVTVNVLTKSEADRKAGSTTTVSDENKDDSWVDVHRKAHKDDQQSGKKTTTKAKQTTTKPAKKSSDETSTKGQSNDGAATTDDRTTTTDDGTATTDETDGSWADADDKAHDDEQKTAQESAAQESDTTTTTDDGNSEPAETTDTPSSDDEVTTVLETVDDGEDGDGAASTDTFGQPGFGFLLSLIAFAGAAFVALRRR